MCWNFKTSVGWDHNPSSRCVYASRKLGNTMKIPVVHIKVERIWKPKITRHSLKVSVFSVSSIFIIRTPPSRIIYIYINNCGIADDEAYHHIWKCKSQIRKRVLFYSDSVVFQFRFCHHSTETRAIKCMLVKCAHASSARIHKSSSCCTGKRLS